MKDILKALRDVAYIFCLEAAIIVILLIMGFLLFADWS
jgi:hypothetical protein